MAANFSGGPPSVCTWRYIFRRRSLSLACKPAPHHAYSRRPIASAALPVSSTSASPTTHCLRLCCHPLSLVACCRSSFTGCTWTLRTLAQPFRSSWTWQVFASRALFAHGCSYERALSQDAGLRVRKHHLVPLRHVALDSNLQSSGKKKGHIHSCHMSVQFDLYIFLY